MRKQQTADQWLESKAMLDQSVVELETAKKALQLLRRQIAEAEGINCPDCGNTGTTYMYVDEAPEPTPCEFCWRAKGTVFRIENFPVDWDMP